MVLGLLGVRGSLTEVRVSSDPNLVLRLLREQRDETRAFRQEFQQFRDEAHASFTAIDTRLTNLEHTVNGMAGHVFALTSIVKAHERRPRKLEARPTKA